MAVNLNKITLEKAGDSHKVNLSKSALTQEIVINLNWTQDTESKKGFFSKLMGGGNEAVDLDLGCYYRLRSGQASVIDGIQFSKGRGGAKNQQTRQGCYTDVPWVWHSGDDRSGASSEGENILVNPRALTELERITVYCFIYEGVAKWADTNAVVTIKVPENPDIVVEMGQQNDSRRFCAIAEIQFGNDSSMTVKKLVTFHGGHGDCDKTYQWGLSWGAGSK